CCSPHMCGSLPNIALVAGRAGYARFRPSRNMNITSISFVCQTAAGSDDAVDVGIYNASGNRIISSGPVTGKVNSIGARTVPLSVSLTGGTTYYAALAAVTPFGSTAASVIHISQGSSAVSVMFSASFGLVELGYMAAGWPLPATLTYAQVSAVPFLAVRE